MQTLEHNRELFELDLRGWHIQLNLRLTEKLRSFPFEQPGRCLPISCCSSPNVRDLIFDECCFSSGDRGIELGQIFSPLSDGRMMNVKFLCGMTDRQPLLHKLADRRKEQGRPL